MLVLALVILLLLSLIEFLNLFLLLVSISTQITCPQLRRSSLLIRMLKLSIWITTSWRRKLRINMMWLSFLQVSCWCQIPNSLWKSLRIYFLRMARSTFWWLSSRRRVCSRNSLERWNPTWNTSLQLTLERSLIRMNLWVYWRRMDSIFRTWKDSLPTQMSSSIHLDSSLLKQTKSDEWKPNSKREKANFMCRCVLGSFLNMILQNSNFLFIL